MRTPHTEFLRACGFVLTLGWDELEEPIPADDGRLFLTVVRLDGEATGERALELTGGKEQVCGVTLSWLSPLEMAAELELGDETPVRLAYTETCAASIVGLLRDTHPELKVPGA